MQGQRKHLVLLGIALYLCLMVSATVSSAETIRYAYDTLNRLIRVEYADGTVFEFSYDKVGNRTRFVRSVGGATTYLITATAGTGGSIAPSGAVPVVAGASVTFTITPESGYIIDDVVVDGGSVGAVNTYIFPAVTSDHTIDALFSPVSPGGEHVIHATTNTGGSIVPVGKVLVPDGGNQLLTILPDAGYQIKQMQIDNTKIEPVYFYTFTNVHENHRIHIVFERITTK